MKKWSDIFLASVVLASIVSIFFILQGRGQIQQGSSEWKHFSEKGISFTFDYPPELNVALTWHDQGSAYNHKLFPKIALAEKMYISVMPASLGLEDLIVEGDNKGPKLVKRITIDGYEAGVFESEGGVELSQESQYSVFFNAQGLAYSINFIGKVDERLLATFKVLNSP